MKKPNFTRSRRGVALISITLVGLVLVTLSLALVLRSTADKTSTSRNRSSVQDTAAVEAAISRGRARIIRAFKNPVVGGPTQVFRTNQATLNGVASYSIVPVTSGESTEPAGTVDDETFVPAAGSSPAYYQFNYDDDNDNSNATPTPSRRVRYTIRLEPICWDTTCVTYAPSAPGTPIVSTTNVPYSYFGNSALCPSTGNVRNADINSGWCTGTAAQGMFQSYIITAVLDDVPGKPWVALQTKVTVTRKSPFRSNFVSYKDNLEIFPGGGFTIRGGVQSNVNIYTGNDVNFKNIVDSNVSGYDATDSQIQATGQITIGRLHCNGFTGSPCPQSTNNSVNIWVPNSSGTYAAVAMDTTKDSVNVANTSATGTEYANIGNTASQVASSPGVGQWAVDSSWNSNTNLYKDSSAGTGSRVKTGVAPIEIPNADSLNPNSSSNTTIQSANSNGLRVETVAVNTSPPIPPVGFLNLLPGETVVWRNGQAIAVVSADGLTEWPAQNTGTAGTTSSNSVVKGAVPRGIGTGTENCNSAPPSIAGFTAPSTALSVTATERKFPKCTFYTSEFRDGREAATGPSKVKVTNVRVDALAKSGLAPESGLIYATRLDAVAGTGSSRVPNGIRIQNGSIVPSEAIVASGGTPCAANASLNCRSISNFNLTTNNPAYIQGDFNLHTTGTDKWKPATVISDATTVLSNAWTDTNNQSGNNNNASYTQVNAVIATGNVASVGQDYSGGLENFVRLLENWNNSSCAAGSPGGTVCTLKLSGALIQLWRSSFATGKWGGNYYSAPGLRDWTYDRELQVQPDDVFGAGLAAGTITTVGGIDLAGRKTLTLAEMAAVNPFDRIPVN